MLSLPCCGHVIVVDKSFLFQIFFLSFSTPPRPKASTRVLVESRALDSISKMRGAKDGRPLSGGSASKMRLDQIFSLFLLLAFILFSLFYLQHILSGPPERTYTNPLLERQLAALRNRQGKVKAKANVDLSAMNDIDRYEAEERRDLGRDVEERQMAA